MSDIRVGLAGDAARFLSTDTIVWFNEELPAPVETQLLGLPADQRFAAEVDESDPSAYAGIYGVYPLELAVPGERLVPCAGLTWVGVHPDHRRRGVLTAMLRHHLEQVRDTPGTHVSALHASEPAIYGRYGYGLASLELPITLARGTKLTAPGLEAEAGAVTTQLAATTDPRTPRRMHECHRQVADAGTVVGAPEFYERVCLQFPEWLRDREPWRVLFARRDGRDVGFAMFRRESKWEDARPAGRLVALLLVGAPAARLALVRRLVDFDLIGSVQLRTGSVEDPVFAWTGGPRAATKVETYDSLWIRLVDLPEALTARSWSTPCDVVVEVADKHAPWNEGRWRIHADGSGTASVERTDAEAELRLPVEALGSAYLGGGNLAALARAGLVAESRPGVASELWRALRTDVPPGASMMF
jgi:GNAT superfamily N-acetyltransferase